MAEGITIMSSASAGFIHWLLVLFLLPLAGLPARSAEPADAPRVKVCVITILATERDNKVDRKLECIARQVRLKHEKLTGFRCLGQMACKSLEVGTPQTFDLIEKQTVVVTVLHGADDDDRVGLKVVPPQMGEITYTTCCGKFFPIVTPVRTKNNDLLLIAVRVQPCHGK
jgi:hypothetical protein